MKNMRRNRSTFYVALIFAMFCWSCGQSHKAEKELAQAKNLSTESKFTQAEQVFHQIAARYPDIKNVQTQVQQELGDIAMRRNHPVAAVKHLLKAAEWAPDDVKIKIALAKSYLAAKKFVQAGETIDHLLSLHGVHTEALLLKASLLIGRHELEAAEKLLHDMLARGIDQTEIYLLLATIKAQNQDQSGVLETLRAGVEKHPQSVSLHALLANYHIRKQNSDEAATVMRKIIELEPDSLSHPLALAGLYWDTRRPEMAEPIIRTYLEGKDNISGRHLALAEFYLNRSRNEEAEKILREGIQVAPTSFSLFRGLGQYYRTVGDFGRAIQVLEDYLKDTESKGAQELNEGRMMLASLHFERNDLESATRYVDQVISKVPDHADANLLRGSISRMQGKNNQALASFQNVVRVRPDIIDAYIKLAETHIFMNELEKSVEVIRQGLGVVPEAKNLHVALARSQIARKDYKSAEDAYVKAMQIDPADYRVQAELGDFYLSLKETARAEREYAEIVNKYPKEAVGYLKLARLYRQQQNLSAATAELRQGYQNNPNSAPMLEELALSLVAANRGDEAVAICKHRIAQNDDEAFTHDLLGRILAHQGKNKDAENAFLKAAELAPQWTAPANNLAAFYLKDGNRSAAVKNLESALLQNPRNPSAYLVLGKIYEQDGKRQSAMGIYERALEAIPELWVAANQLALLLCAPEQNSQTLDRARAIALRAYQTKPGEPSVVDTLGWIHFLKGEIPESLNLYRQIESSIGDNPTANYHMAMVLLKAGREDTARKKLEIALRDKTGFADRAQAEKVLSSLKSRS
jgi:tetratricopeptide (TPR) repeat protein